MWRGAAGAFFRSADDYEFSAGSSGDAGDGAPRGGAGEALNSGFQNVGGVGVAERTIGLGELRVAALGTHATDVGRPTTKPGRLDTIETEDHALLSARYSRSEGSERTEWAMGGHRPRTVNRAERFDDAGARTRTSHLENVSLDLSASGLIERPQHDGTWLAGADAFLREGVDATETTVRFDGEVPDDSAALPAAGTPTGPAEIVPLIRDGRRLDLGAFLGWKRPVGYLGELRFAGRLDWAHRQASKRTSVSWVSPSVTVGVVLPLHVSWALTGSASRSFRAPRIQELYFQGDRPTGFRLANPELKPETAWSLEGGIRWASGPWKAEGLVWGIVAEDLIVQLPVSDSGDSLRYRNEDTGLLGGSELSFAWSPPSGRARASVAYALLTGENEDAHALPDIPSGELRAVGNVRVWRQGERSARVRTTLRAGAAKTPLLAGQDERSWSPWLGATDIGGDEVPHPGFARWDLGLLLRVSPAAEIDLAVDNLVDSRYIDRPEADAYPQPGRTYRVRLTVGAL